MQLPSDELAVSVRDALLADAPRMVTLALQLGYEVPLEHVEAILRSPEANRAIMVAVVPRAGVVGLGLGWTLDSIVLDVAALHRTLPRTNEPISYDDRFFVTLRVPF